MACHGLTEPVPFSWHLAFAMSTTSEGATAMSFLVFRSVRGTSDPLYSPFANSYLPITYFTELISSKVTDTVTDVLFFELIKVTVTDGPVGVLPPPSSNCQESYRFVIPEYYFQESYRYRYRFLIFLN